MLRKPTASTSATSSTTSQSTSSSSTSSSSSSSTLPKSTSSSSSTVVAKSSTSVVLAFTPLFEAPVTSPGVETTVALVPPTTIVAEPMPDVGDTFLAQNSEIEVTIKSVDMQLDQSSKQRDNRLVVAAGAFIEVVGHGFAPLDEVEVWLFSTPKLLANMPTSVQGDVRGLVRVPTGLEIGEHHLELRGSTESSKSVMVNVDLVVDATPQPQLEMLADLRPNVRTKTWIITAKSDATVLNVPTERVIEIVSSIVGSEVSDAKVLLRASGKNWARFDPKSAFTLVNVHSIPTYVEIEVTASDGHVYNEVLIVMSETETDYFPYVVVGLLLLIGIALLLVSRNRQNYL